MRAAVLLSCLCLSVAAANPGTLAHRGPELVAKLGSPNYPDREAASRELDALGEPALAWLRSAVGSPDSETSRRAAELVRRIEHRIAAARILAPTLVDVNYQNTSLDKALTDFQAKTKLPVELAGGRAQLGSRTVTYRSGQVPVWEALAGFTRAAGLAEWDGLTPVAGTPTPVVQNNEDDKRVVLPQGRIIVRSSPRVNAAPHLQKVILYEGSSAVLPACYAGAVRVRALPVGTVLPGVVSEPDEYVIPLQVSLEPRLTWPTSSTPAVKVAQAIDDQGNGLIASVVANVPRVSADEQILFLGGNLMDGPLGPGGLSQRSHHVALRLRKGQQPSKRIAEVSGSLSVPLRVAGEVVAVENPLKAAGQAVRTPFAALTVHSAERTEAGELRFDVSVELAPDVGMQHFIPGGRAAMPNLPMQVQVQNNVVVQQINGGKFDFAGRTATEFMGLSLADGTGQRFQMAGVGRQQVSYDFQGTRLRTVISFKAGDGAAEPTRLAFAGTHPATVEVPFKFTGIAIE